MQLRASGCFTASDKHAVISKLVLTVLLILTEETLKKARVCRLLFKQSGMGGVFLMQVVTKYVGVTEDVNRLSTSLETD